MTAKDNLEEEVKEIKRHFGGVVSLNESLEKKLEPHNNPEIMILLRSRQNLVKLLWIDKEIE